MAERDDAGVTEDEIEREREHHHDQHLAAEGHAIRKDEECGERDQPRQRLRPMAMVAALQIGGGALARGLPVGTGGGFTHGRRTPPA
ncbi:MAG: hypothetical protein WDN48_12385 [Pseudolabrys sp.]